MVLIFTIAGVAAAAIKAFNRLPAPQRAAVVTAISQGTSVLLALTTAVQWVTMGLQGLTKMQMFPSLGGSGSQIQVGRPASVQAA